eukprot:SAG31_NODE_18081_length_647_cov_1.483577_1_plen_188_part_10
MAELQRLKVERRERLAAQAAAAEAAAEAARVAAAAEAKEKAAREQAAKHVRPKLEPLLQVRSLVEVSLVTDSAVGDLNLLIRRYVPVLQKAEATWEEMYPFLLEHSVDMIQTALSEPDELVQQLLSAFANSAATGQDNSSSTQGEQLDPEPDSELQLALPRPGARRLRKERSRLRLRLQEIQQAAAVK